MELPQRREMRFVDFATDLDPYLDDCGADKGGTVANQFTVELTGKNVGDLLNEKGVTNMFDDEPHRARFFLDPVTGTQIRPSRY